ncbi:MAG: hypothetical protein KGI19_07770 [Thaumarchaeota archaeon]|nr:hypothetical protein [Nitrososphaerota archaeon]
MSIITDAKIYIFIGLTIVFGGFEVYDKLYPIQNFGYVDVFGVLSTIVVSAILLIWELNRVILSHYPSVIVLSDLGHDDFIGIDSGHLDADGKPIEGKLIIMLKRKGHLKHFIRPIKVSIKTRQQINVECSGNSGLVSIRYDGNNDEIQDGFISRQYIFDEIVMEEDMLNYYFTIRCLKKDINLTQQIQNSNIFPDLSIEFDYKFGFKKQIFPVTEKTEIKMK